MRQSEPTAVLGAGRPHSRRPRLRSGAVTIALMAALAAPGVATAKAPSSKSVSLRAGSVTVKFNAGTFGALTKSTSGSFASTRTVSPVAPGASAAPGVFAFPLASAKVNVKKLTGQATSKGGLDFTHVSTLPLLGTSTTQFVLKSFALHLGGSGPVLSCTFVGASTTPNVPFATLVTTRAKHSKHGRTVMISGLSLKLTQSGVQLLNGQSSGFKVGQVIGTASVTGTT